MREPERLTAEVIESFPHDNQAFTQGLLYHGENLYESTGQYGESTLRKVDLETGRIEEVRYLSDEHFGEGLVFLGGKFYQLTWKAGVGFVYDAESLRRLSEFSYEGEGWGLATDGEHLIMSDGSATLRFLDPATFEVVRRVVVRDHRGRVEDLNELEHVDGQLFANLWYKDEIIRIDPASGHVTGVLALRGLLRPVPSDPDSVLNGIAHDPRKNLFYVTGKRWPRLFSLRISGPTH